METSFSNDQSKIMINVKGCSIGSFVGLQMTDEEDQIAEVDVEEVQMKLLKF